MMNVQQVQIRQADRPLASDELLRVLEIAATTTDAEIRQHAKAILARELNPMMVAYGTDEKRNFAQQGAGSLLGKTNAE